MGWQDSQKVTLVLSAEGGREAQEVSIYEKIFPLKVVGIKKICWDKEWLLG